jgi:hypothetical protein
MSVDWTKVAQEFWDRQPHPKDPSGHLKIGEFATAVKLATTLKFGGHASAHEATLFWREFAPGGVPIMSLQEFEHAVERIAPVSFTFHGRPPSMQELVQFKDKLPHEVSKYFGDLPDRHYPSVPSSAMVKHLAWAEPHAQEHLGRPPVKYEAHLLYHSGEHPRDFYSKLGEQAKQSQDKLPDSTNVVQASFR